MKHLVKFVLIPALLVAGLTLIPAEQAEARWWVRRPVVRAATVPARVTVGPRVRVVAPYYRPRVYVGPPAVYGPRYYGGWGYRHGGVVAPGVQVWW